MLKMKLYSKLTPVLLIVAIFCTACDVPDISDFTKQSAAMTSGIRTGIKNTETLIKTASERDDLYSDATRTKLKKDLKDYQTGMKPTVAALDALDAYLDALNALSLANKKSGENASAVVKSVGSLVTAVSGLTLASSVVNVASGLFGLAEQFRTSKDFKKRVNLAGTIVEGRFDEKTESYLDKGEIKQRTILVKACSEDAGDQITTMSKTIKAIVDPILSPLTKEQSATLKALPLLDQPAKLKEMKKASAEQQAALKTLSPQEKRKKLHEWGLLSDVEYATVEDSETKIAAFGCGVIDFIKFNIKDLKEINQAVSQDMARDVQRKNRTVLGYYDSIVANDGRTQNELETILNYKNLVSLIRENEATGASADSIRDSKIKVKEYLDNLFILDGQLKVDTIRGIERCGAACGRMKDYLEFRLCDTCENQILAIIDSITKDQFDKSNGYIEAVLEARTGKLDAQNDKYLEDLKRITPAHSDAMGEFTTIKNNQSQLDALFDSSLSALDSWAKTHANLRVAVNTKKPLTVSALASKVTEIWGILNPAKK